MHRKTPAIYVEQAIIIFRLKHIPKKNCTPARWDENIKNFYFQWTRIISTIQRLYKCLQTKWNSSNSCLIYWKQFDVLKNLRLGRHFSIKCILTFSLKSVFFQLHTFVLGISHSFLVFWHELCFVLHQFLSSDLSLEITINIKGYFVG